MRVLVVEDFEVMARSIGIGLRREGMAVDVVLDGNHALSHLALTRYDVVVLDRDLPGMHGDEICRQIVAERSGSRILMLTAASTVKERVDGLGLGPRVLRQTRIPEPRGVWRVSCGCLSGSPSDDPGTEGVAG